MYILFYIVALLVGFILLLSSTKSVIDWRMLIVYIIVTGFISFYGSRCLSIIETMGFKEITIKNLLDSKNGLTFYGGYIPLFIITFWMISKNSHNVYEQEKVSLNFIITFLVCYSIGRLGCHFSADGCYGKVTFNGMGIRYTWGSCQTLFPVYPTSVYEAILNFSIAMLFIFINYKYPQSKVYLISSFFLIFPLSRFLIEFIRVNRPIYNDYTLNHILSIFLIPFNFIIHFSIKKYHEKNSYSYYIA